MLRKGNLLFEEVTSSLQKILSTFSCSLVNQLANELNETEKMLRQEKSDFEVVISALNIGASVSFRCMSLILKIGLDNMIPLWFVASFNYSHLCRRLLVRTEIGGRLHIIFLI